MKFFYSLFLVFAVGTHSAYAEPKSTHSLNMASEFEPNRILQSVETPPLYVSLRSPIHFDPARSMFGFSPSSLAARGYSTTSLRPNLSFISTGQRSENADKSLSEQLLLMLVAIPFGFLLPMGFSKIGDVWSRS